MIIDSNDADILLKTPMIKRIPGIISASATGICISGGKPRLLKNPPNPGLLNFDMPAAIKMTPIDDLKPINEISARTFLLISLVVNDTRIFFQYNYFSPNPLQNVENPLLCGKVI